MQSCPLALRPTLSLSSIPNPCLVADACTCYAGMHLQGNIRVNGQPRGTAAYKQAYVQQEDMFYAQLTVRWAKLGGVLAQEQVVGTAS